jgi:hypothetical protein
VFFAYFKVLCQHLLDGAEEITTIFQSRQPMPGLRSDEGPLDYEVKLLTIMSLHSVPF